MATIADLRVLMSSWKDMDRALEEAIEDARCNAQLRSGLAIKVYIGASMNEAQQHLAHAHGGGMSFEATVLAVHGLLALHELGHAAHDDSGAMTKIVLGGLGISKGLMQEQEERANDWAAQFVPGHWTEEWAAFVQMNRKNYASMCLEKNPYRVGGRKWKAMRAMNILLGDQAVAPVTRGDRFWSSQAGRWILSRRIVQEYAGQIRAQIEKLK